VVTLILRKFDYVVFKGRKAYEDGGVLRGYQLKDRVLAGERKLRVGSCELGVERDKPETRNQEPENLNLDPNRQLTTLDLQLKTFTYVYMTSDRVRHRGEIMAETKEDAYSRLRAQKIRPIRVLAEGEAEPPPKIFAKKAEKSTDANA